MRRRQRPEKSFMSPRPPFRSMRGGAVTSLLAGRWWMRWRRSGLGGLGVLAGVLWAGVAHGQPAAAPVRPSGQWERLRAAAQVPLGEVPAAVRDRVRQVLDRPTLYSHGPSETFLCRPALYYWFLDHPDRAVLTWRRLGA